MFDSVSAPAQSQPARSAGCTGASRATAKRWLSLTQATGRLERLPIPIILVLLTALLFAVRFRDAQHLDSHASLKAARLPALSLALRAAPTSWYTWCRIARRAGRSRSRARAEFAEWCHSQATVYDPHNYRLWLSLGKRRLRLRDNAGGRAAFERVRSLRSWVRVPEVPPDRLGKDSK